MEVLVGRRPRIDVGVLGRLVRLLHGTCAHVQDLACASGRTGLGRASKWSQDGRVEPRCLGDACVAIQLDMPMTRKAAWQVCLVKRVLARALAALETVHAPADSKAVQVDSRRTAQHARFRNGTRVRSGRPSRATADSLFAQPGGAGPQGHKEGQNVRHEGTNTSCAAPGERKPPPPLTRRLSLAQLALRLSLQRETGDASGKRGA
eukprot:111031-Chlamydomonas_euryale.AAC.1